MSKLSFLVQSEPLQEALPQPLALRAAKSQRTSLTSGKKSRCRRILTAKSESFRSAIFISLVYRSVNTMTRQRSTP